MASETSTPTPTPTLIQTNITKLPAFLVGDEVHSLLKEKIGYLEKVVIKKIVYNQQNQSYLYKDTWNGIYFEEDLREIPTPTITPTPTLTSTITPTPTLTSTITPTPTLTSTNTPTQVATQLL